MLSLQKLNFLRFTHCRWQSTKDAPQMKTFSDLSKPKKLSDTVEVIELKTKYSPGQNMLIDPPRYVYIRNFYSELLATVRKFRYSVLMGNPGIGKSIFQYYYLARIFNTQTFGTLPPNCFGNTNAPHKIIRQVGKKNQIYNVRENSYQYLLANNPPNFTNYNHEEDIYLYEPMELKNEPEFSSLPTLVTVSPDESRYKEFCKNGGVKLYLPNWTLEDLQTVGKHMSDIKCVPEGISYSSEAIQERYEDYGGIFRHVLPISLAQLESTAFSKNQAISEVNLNTIFQIGNIENPQISHFIVTYTDIPKSGEDAFRKRNLNIVNRRTLKKLTDLWKNVDLFQMIRTLIRNDETGYMEIATHKIYEEVISHQLIRGVSWQKRKVNDQQFTQFDLKLERIVDGKPPIFSEMKTLVLYYPTQQNFPAVEFFWKTPEDKFYAVQVTRAEKKVKEVKASALDSMYEILKIPESTEVTIALCPKPKLASSMNIQISDAHSKHSKIQLEVWKLPSDYVQNI